MYREIAFEIIICEDFVRLLIEEKPKELYEVCAFLVHERNHALDIMRSIKIVVVEMHNYLPISSLA